MTSVVIQINAPAPRLSVIVATWNAARTLNRCLDSIIEQNFTDWEPLVADGGPDGGSVYEAVDFCAKAYGIKSE